MVQAISPGAVTSDVQTTLGAFDQNNTNTSALGGTALQGAQQNTDFMQALFAQNVKDTLINSSWQILLTSAKRTEGAARG
jgi:hypothetical protein